MAGKGPGRTLTKAEIVERVHERLGVSRAEARALVEQLLDIIKDALADPEDGQVKVAGFGSFLVRSKAARTGRDPRDASLITIGPRKVLTFKASQLLKNEMNRRAAARRAGS